MTAGYIFVFALFFASIYLIFKVIIFQRYEAGVPTKYKINVYQQQYQENW